MERPSVLQSGMMLQQSNKRFWHFRRLSLLGRLVEGVKCSVLDEELKRESYAHAAALLLNIV
jgi:hypothetical protein